MAGDAEVDEQIADLADQILRSYYFMSGPTRTNINSNTTFPSTKSPPMQIDFPMFVDLPSFNIAALKLRKIMPEEFASVPIEIAKQQISKLINSDMLNFFDETQRNQYAGSFFDAISEVNRIKFHRFFRSALLTISINTFSFPLSKVQIKSRYDGTRFFIIDGEDVVGAGANSILEKAKAQQTIYGWLGCSAAFVESAQKYKRIILGAISLRLPHTERTQKTLAKPASGILTHNRMSWKTSREHMPSIGHDIVVGQGDEWWLKKIDLLLEAPEKEARRKRKALEYFYLGWFLEPNERFAFNLMTLDALFGQGSGKTGEKLKAGVSQALDQTIDARRFDSIVELRSQFLHGGSPDIYDSSKYEIYLQDYNGDPLIDVEYLTASCLRQQVFGSDFTMQQNPYETELKQLETRGLIPTKRASTAIIQES